MKKIIAALILSLSTSACYPLIQDHPCESEDACQAQRAAALAILSGGGFQTPAPQPYRLPLPSRLLTLTCGPYDPRSGVAYINCE